MDKTLCDKEEGRKAYKEKIFEDSHTAHNKKSKMELEPLNPMLFYPAFPHIVQKIFNHMDKERLKTCFHVSFMIGAWVQTNGYNHHLVCKFMGRK